MKRLLLVADRILAHLRPRAVVAWAIVASLTIGVVDFYTGYELSMSLFYLGPVALAAWYGSRRAGFLVAIVSCITWYFADAATGHAYSHPAIPVWNTLVRFGFFAITSVLLDALRASLVAQRRLARTDALTGLFGRRAIETRLQHDLALGQRRKSALTIAYLDLDDFKAVNDTYGHASGDALLRLVGGVLRGTVRESDTPVRMGGDEFAIVMPDTEADEAHELMTRLADSLRAALGANPFHVNWSIGVVTFPESAVTVDAALAAADAVMYGVKRSGKGAIAFDVAHAATGLEASRRSPHAMLH